MSSFKGNSCNEAEESRTIPLNNMSERRKRLSGIIIYLYSRALFLRGLSHTEEIRINVLANITEPGIYAKFNHGTMQTSDGL